MSGLAIHLLITVLHSKVALLRALSLSTLQRPLQAHDSVELALLGKNNNGATALWSYGNDELALEQEKWKTKKIRGGQERTLRCWSSWKGRVMI